ASGADQGILPRTRARPSLTLKAQLQDQRRRDGTKASGADQGIRPTDPSTPIAYAQGFHEKAGFCQVKIYDSEKICDRWRGIAQGGWPSCGGSRPGLAAWGEPAPPGFPQGKRERGKALVPRCRRLFCF